MKRLRQRIANWCTLHHIPIRLYLWLCVEYEHVQCEHPRCQPSVYNPVGICLDTLVDTRSKCGHPRCNPNIINPLGTCVQAAVWGLPEGYTE